MDFSSFLVCFPGFEEDDAFRSLSFHDVLRLSPAEMRSRECN